MDYNRDINLVTICNLDIPTVTVPDLAKATDCNDRSVI
jgi:hypothetical protein